MKSKTEILGRRDFILKSLVTGAGLIGLVACSGASAPGYGGGTASGGGTSAGTCANGANTTYLNVTHAHTTIVLAAAAITNAVPGTYTLLTGSHNHTFSLTAQDFADVAALKSIVKVDLEGHGHQLQILC